MCELTAYHEAGHAMMAIMVGANVHSLTISPDRDDGPLRTGDAQILWPRRASDPRRLCWQQILVALAGPVAEMIYRGEPLHPAGVAEWGQDWQNAWEAAEQIAPEPQMRMQILERQAVQLYHLLKDDRNWAALAAIVDELLAHELLEGSEVVEIMDQWLG